LTAGPESRTFLPPAMSPGFVGCASRLSLAESLGVAAGPAEGKFGGGKARRARGPEQPDLRHAHHRGGTHPDRHCIQTFPGGGFRRHREPALLQRQHPMLFGDAKASLQALVSEFKGG